MQGGVNGYWADEGDLTKPAAVGDAALPVYFYTGRHWRQPMGEDGIPTGPAEWFDVPFIHIELGDANLVPDRLAWIDERHPYADNRRWPKAWEAYKSGQAAGLTGTPLEQWPLILKGQIETCRHRHIYTVEQLANLPDGNAQFLGGLELREQAKKWLRDRAEASVAKTSDVDAIRAELSAMKEENAKLLALAEARPAAVPPTVRKRGRPPKQAVAP
jgi:hypothetical protein